MPHFRKLHIKVTESLDVNDMSSDFVRLMWVLLPLKCCSKGRGMYHPTWIKSQLFPLRTDVTDEMVDGAMLEYINLRMIIAYEVDGRRYFQIRKWDDYQNTAREADSPYPAPLPKQNGEPPIPAQDVDLSNSGVTQELVMSNSGVGDHNSARTSSISISNSISSSDSYSRGGMGGILHDGHEENQQHADVLTAICNVVKGEDPNAPNGDLERIAYRIWESGTIDRVAGFTQWWGVNGFYDGRPALKSFIKEWDNYLDGITLTKGIKQQSAPGAAMQAAQEYAELKARFGDGTGNN